MRCAPRAVEPVAQQSEIFDKPRRHCRLKGRGYAGTPGTGPIGETCKTCAQLRCHTRTYGSGQRRWYKCALVKVTYSVDTDIRLDAPACHAWTAATPSTDQ